MSSARAPQLPHDGRQIGKERLRFQCAKWISLNFIPWLKPRRPWWTRRRKTGLRIDPSARNGHFRQQVFPISSMLGRLVDLDLPELARSPLSLNGDCSCYLINAPPLLASSFPAQGNLPSILSHTLSRSFFPDHPTTANRKPTSTIGGSAVWGDHH